MGGARYCRECSGFFRTISDTRFANICVISARASVTPKAVLVAYSTRFNSVFAQSQTPAKAGSIPSGGRLGDPKESAVKLNGNAKQLNLGTRAEACLAGEVRKCLATDRTVRRGKSVGKIAILNGSRPFLLALAPVHPFALVAERPRQRLISAVDVLRLFETWHLRYLSTMQRGPCSHLSA
jgi:hypothetical protein